MSAPEITFLPVKDNQTKIRTICQTIQHHYDAGESILITTANQEAAKFVDELLWRFPQESFLPHVYTLKPTKSKIAVTTKQENLNQSTVLFNLCPHACPIYNQFQHVYELFDETHPEKRRLSEERKTTYRVRDRSSC